MVYGYHDLQAPLQTRVIRNVDKGVCGDEFPDQPKWATGSFKLLPQERRLHGTRVVQRMSGSDRRIELDA